MKIEIPIKIDEEEIGKRIGYFIFKELRFLIHEEIKLALKDEQKDKQKRLLK
jgi:hypothetical protein